MNDYDRYVRIMRYVSSLKVLIREYIEAQQQARLGRSEAKVTAQRADEWQKDAAKILEKVIAKLEELEGPKFIEALKELDRFVASSESEGIDLSDNWDDDDRLSISGEELG